MTSPRPRPHGRARRLSLLRGEDGSATIEFVILFPVFMAVFFSAFESGLLMARNLMLERGTDIAVRELRIKDPATIELDALKTLICRSAVILGECESNMGIELVPARLGSGAPIDGEIACNDDDSRLPPGSDDELMMVRVCVHATLFFPMGGLGLLLPKTVDGQYAFVATSAFVNEPGR